MKKRWLITGAGGQLGSEFANLFDADPEVYAFNSSELDVTNSETLKNTIDSVRPSHILNCAAWTNVEKAEINHAEVMEINAYAVGNLASISKRLGIHLTHFSTDYVFDGQKESPYETDDSINPLSNYGLSKSIGEDAIRDIYPEGALIIRTSWLYSRYGSNFLKTMLRLEQERETISVIQDQVGQPTSAADLASFILRILRDRDLVGIFHASNSGSASWYEFACEIFRLKGKDPARILPIKSSEYPQVAKRPQFSVLSLSKWRSVGVDPMQSWQEALFDTFQNGQLKKEPLGGN